MIPHRTVLLKKSLRTFLVFFTRWE